MILCDTNILIEFYRGSPSIVATLHDIGLPELAISVITAAELYFGARDQQELHIIREHLSLLHQFSLDEGISQTFLSLLEVYSLSHKLCIPDALIAATALKNNLLLYTLNVKDFRFIQGLLLYKS